MKNTFDYIVIGSGHNGMSAACTLAMAGKSVLVVEQRHITGGLSASHAYVKEAPKHLLSVGAMDDALMGHSSLIADLKLKHYGYSSPKLQAPYGWMGEDGETLLLHANFDRTVEEIRYFSPQDAKTYIDVRAAIDLVIGGLEKVMPHHPAKLPKLDLGRMLVGLTTDKRTRKVITRMLSVSAFEMIMETFESDAMRGLWSYWADMFAPATVQGSGIYLASFGSVHRAGIFRPIGGMSGLIGALEKCLAAYGGEIRLNSKVEKLLMEGRQVKGVRIVGGEEFFARRGVLANCSPQIALGNLLPDSVNDRSMREKVSFIPSNSIAVAPFKIDIAVGGRVGYPRAEAKRRQRDDMDVRKTTFMTGTIEQQIAQHKACLRGEMVSFPLPMYFSILSANDESIAPKGEDVVYLYANSPLDPVGGWDACKEDYCHRIMDAMKPFMGGLEAEIGRVETSPKDFQERFGAYNAAFFHVDMVPTRLGINRPAPGLGGYKTPFEGYYLCGAGSHPSGGICGWNGRLAAQHAMEFE